MPPRILRRPSFATTPLKKRPPRISEDTTAAAAPLSNHQPYRPPKEEKEDGEFAVDKSERLELEYNDPYYEVEEDGSENLGMEEHWDMKRVEEEEEGGEERIEGEYMMEAEEVEGEEELSEGEVGDVNDVELGGFEEVRHDVAKDRRKRKEFEVFVGGLDRDASEEDLRKVFSQVGEIAEVRLMKNPLTKKNKGFAFIRFKTVEQSRRAVNELKRPLINGKQCGVAPSQDSDTLFIGNICRTWRKEILKEKLIHYGVDNFEELTLVEDTKNEGMNRGFAFLDFSSRADALEACKRLQKRDVVFGTDRTARVAFADTFIEPDDEIMSQVRTVFIDGLPSTWDEDRVKGFLKKFGRIEKVELARNMPAAKRTDFGFITFDTHDAAVACVDGINDSELDYGYKKVKVRARLSRPRQRGKSAKHARGGYPVRQVGGRGLQASWSSSMSRMDTWRFSDRNGRGIPTGRANGSGLKRSFDLRDRHPSRDLVGNRDRHPSRDLVANRTGSRRQFPSPDRSYKRRSPGSFRTVSAHGQNTIKRDYMQEDESFARPSEFDRVSIERQSYRDAYLSRRSGYSEDSPRSVSHVAARRISPFYDDDDDDDDDNNGYGYMEHSSSYCDTHSRGYSSFSGLKRPYSAIEEAHPRYNESGSKQSRTRFDYGGSSGLPYGDSSYRSDSTRLGRGSRSGYDGSRSSAGNSRGLYDRTTSSMGYRREEISRGDTEEMYSRYGRDQESQDYIRSRSHLDADSYPPVYSNRRMNDGYLGDKVSGSYY